MKTFLLNLPDPPGIHVFRFHSAGFGSSFVMPHKNHRYDVYPPIYEAYAAAVLENEGHKVSVLDSQSPNLPLKQILTEIERQNPEVIVSRICLPSFDHDLDLLRQIKRAFPDILFVGWGGMCKVFPQEVLEKSTLDMVIRAVELESSLPEVVSAVENGRTKDIAGVSITKDGKIVHGPDRPFVKNLDAIPLPAYHLLDMKKYVAQESRYVYGGSEDKFIPFFSVSGSRGCSFNCMYCPYPVTYGPWRGRSPNKLVDEIEILAENYGINTIWFHDQTFSMNLKRTEALCDEIVTRGLDIHWATETRIDRLNPAILQKMRDSGCSRLEIGVETGDPYLLKTIGKRGLTTEKIERTVQAIKDKEIIVEANLLVGLPGESWTSIENTVKLMKRVKPDIVTAMVVTPYPGTPLFRMAEENGWLLTKDWEKYTLFNPVLSYPEFTNKDIMDARRYLYRQLTIHGRMQKIVGDLRNLKMTEAAKTAVSNIPVFLKNLPSIVKNKLK